jgi:hypothetical protein
MACEGCSERGQCSVDREVSGATWSLCAALVASIEHCPHYNFYVGFHARFLALRGDAKLICRLRDQDPSTLFSHPGFFCIFDSMDAAEESSAPSSSARATRAAPTAPAAPAGGATAGAGASATTALRRRSASDAAAVGAAAAAAGALPEPNSPHFERLPPAVFGTVLDLVISASNPGSVVALALVRPGGGQGWPGTKCFNR